MAQDRSIVPMINVVFLLLIFFLMTASLVAPPPMEVTAPMAETAPTDPLPGTLFMDARGALAFGEHSGDAVWPALEAEAPVSLPVLADASTPAAELARLLSRLERIGVTDMELRTRLP